MSISIHLTEGPNVLGLLEGRVSLYVGYDYHQAEPAWIVIEGRKIGTPREYKLHLQQDGEKSLVEAPMTRFEYTLERTTLDFVFKGSAGKLIISNTSNSVSFLQNGQETNKETVYNFFGDGKCDMRPSSKIAAEFYK